MTPSRTPGPSESVTINEALLHKRSQLQGSPALKDPVVVRFACVGAGGERAACPSPWGGAGLPAQVWRRDWTRGPPRAPPGSSHAKATTEWAERMSNQEGAARWSLGHQRFAGGLSERW